MSDIQTGTSQEGFAPAPTETGANPTPTQFSDLARNRAQYQGASQGTGTQSDSGRAVPNSQDSQRSEYIPRERFDEVNSKKNAAESELQALRQQITQAQMLAAARANAGQYNPQPQQQPHATQAQVQDFLASISSKEEQEKWRTKIMNQPVVGIAELIQEAIRSESGKLLNQINATLAPVQQSYLQQQGQSIQAYAQKRATSPEWGAISGTFAQLAQTAAQRGYALTPQSLEVIESVARAQHGIPMFGGAPAAQPPFTERPGSAQPLHAPQQTPVLTAEQKKYAQMFGMSEQQYAANYAALAGGAR